MEPLNLRWVLCVVFLSTTDIPSEGQAMMAHVKIVIRWEKRKLTGVPTYARVRAHPGEEKFDAFLSTVYVDDYLLARVQHSDDDAAALIASASLAPYHVRLFGLGEEGIPSIFAPKKKTDYDASIDVLGFTVNSHTPRFSYPRENSEMIKRLPHNQRLASRKDGNVYEVLSVAGKLWNLTNIVSARR